MTVVDPKLGAISTTCPYCGVGCGVLATPDGRGGAAIAGDPDHPANLGRLCSKGSALGETLALDGRLLYPMIRCSKGTMERVAWTDALDHVAHRLAAHHQARRPGRGRVLSLRAASDRGLLRRQQADEGICRQRQYRYQFAAVHGLVGRRPPPRLRHRYRARLLSRISTRPTSWCWSDPTRPGAIRCCTSACSPTSFRAARASSSSIRAALTPPSDADLHLPVEARHRRARCSTAFWRTWPTAARSTPAISIATPPASTRRCARARNIAGIAAATAAATVLPSRCRRLLPAVRDAPAGRHAVFARRQPVGAGHRQGQRHHQLPPGYRPDRQARHGRRSRSPASPTRWADARSAASPISSPRIWIYAAGHRPRAAGSGTRRASRTARG